MSEFDKLQPCSFDGIKFPIQEIQVRGGLRTHTHEYPHAPGGALEKLGRKLYTFHIKASFQNTFAKYPGLWSQALPTLRNLWESETTGDLVLPNLGTVRAVCTNWTQTMQAHIRSGELVDLEFEEDQSQAYLVNALFVVSTQTVDTAAKTYTAESLRLQLVDPDHHSSLFDAITDSVNSVLAFVDTAQSYGNLLAAKIEAATTLIQQADQRLAVLNDPVNHELLEAMLDLWDSLNKLNDDIQKTNGRLLTYAVQRPMSVLELSQALYNGDGTRAVELMQLNPLDDPFLVPIGTQLRYYQQTSVAA